MRRAIWASIACTIIAALASQWWRYSDARALLNVWQSLVSRSNQQPAIFEPALVVDLPEPARRFFDAVIEPGTPIRTVAEVTMQGEFSLGTKENHSYLPMRACQLLAPPYGFYWRVTAGEGFMQFMGSDGSVELDSWTRFWLTGLVPVARLGNSADHARSSFGRYMADSLFWVPGALLPSKSVVWSPLSSDSARVTIDYKGIRQAYDLTVGEDGRPIKIRFERWSDANATKTYQLQAFGGCLSDFKKFDGYWLPSTIVAGNHFETDEYFPFFKATVETVRFIDSPDSEPQCLP